MAAALAMAILPPAALARFLGAEGPLALLSVWSGSVVVLAGAALGRRSEVVPPNAPSRRLSFAAGLIAAIAGGAGVLVALVQLNVARRSLAEAWIGLARQGEAFGFFSFFAAELYALFCLGSALLCAARRPLSAMAALLASTAFAVGVIWGDARSLAVAIVTAAAVPVFAVRSRPGVTAFGRLRAAIPPAVVAVLAALPFAFLGRGGSSYPILRPFDLTPVVRSIVPSFPLLLEVPGYGFEIGAARLAPNIYLSDGVLFEAEGDGPGLRYVVSSVYSDWSEGSWRESAAFGKNVSVVRRDSPRPRPAGALRLRLDEDFYSVVPVERQTATVTLTGAAPETEKATLNQGVRFSGVARRGLEADLERPSGRDAGGESDAEDAPGGRWTVPGADESGRIAALARALVARAGPTAGALGPDRDRAVIRAILDHFKEGYAYALNVRGGADGEVALERFLFEERKGYCLHYATAFTLLARCAGISARVVEGFRVSLGETGRGTVKGVDAHAWVEAWVDGAWRVFEPTPPFASPNPFAYLAAGDAAARRQLETLFGRPASVRGEERESAGAPVLFACIALAIASLIAAYAVTRFAAVPRGNPEVRAEKRRAKKLVRYAKSLGLAGPETLGWTGWARAAGSFVEDQEARGGRPARRIAALRGAEKTAERMISLTFDVESP